LLLMGAGLAAAGAGAYVIFTDMRQGAAQPVAAAANTRTGANLAPAAGGASQSFSGDGADGSDPADIPPTESTQAAVLPEPEQRPSGHASGPSAADAMASTRLPPSTRPEQTMARATPQPSLGASSAGASLEARRKQCI